MVEEKLNSVFMHCNTYISLFGENLYFFILGS